MWVGAVTDYAGQLWENFHDWYQSSFVILRTHIYHCFHQHVPIKGTFYHPAIIWYIQCVPKNSGQFKYILLRLWFSSMLVISTWTVVVNTSLACVFDLLSSFLKTDDIFICWPFSSLPILRHFDASTLRNFNPTNFSILQLYRRFDTSILPTSRHFNSTDTTTLRHFNSIVGHHDSKLTSWPDHPASQLSCLSCPLFPFIDFCHRSILSDIEDTSTLHCLVSWLFVVAC